MRIIMMFGTDFCKLIEKTFWSCLKRFGLWPFISGVTWSYLSAPLCSSNTFGKKRRRTRNKTFGAMVLQMIFVVFFMELSVAGKLYLQNIKSGPLLGSKPNVNQSHRNRLGDTSTTVQKDTLELLLLWHLSWLHPDHAGREFRSIFSNQ